MQTCVAANRLWRNEESRAKCTHAHEIIDIGRQHVSHAPLRVTLALWKLEVPSTAARWLGADDKGSGADPGQRDTEEARETSMSCE